MRRTNPHAADLRRNATDAERALWHVLRNRQIEGRKFRRQATIGPYIADFLCIEDRLIVEVDGGQHSEAADAARTGYLARSGFRVVHYWNNDVLENLEGVIADLRTHLTSPPSPNPLPPAEPPSPNPLPPAGEG
jgi:very-short-patch-repair endonuclease